MAKDFWLHGRILFEIIYKIGHKKKKQEYLIYERGLIAYHWVKYRNFNKY